MITDSCLMVDVSDSDYMSFVPCSVDSLGYLISTKDIPIDVLDLVYEDLYFYISAHFHYLLQE